VIVCGTCAHENPDEARFCMSCGAPLVAAARAAEARKTVSIVFCDVTGSTELGERLDPETLSKVMQRYFDTMREPIERHGGTVEKFIGDAVMAVFGVPTLHEDDAMRAVRAAEDMREALVSLNEELARERGVSIRTRTGVNTGEVLMGAHSAEEGLVTGDAVNVAARLEQAAAPGEILLGWQTFRLTRDAVDVEPVEPLELKGKSEPVPAFRLIRSIPGAEGHARRTDSPMVGRESELQLLSQAFDRTTRERTCVLFTVLGTAGVGKSRLSTEFLKTIDARVLGGRCLHYGEGITYWPIVEILHQAAGIQETDGPDEARAKLAGAIADAPDADVILARIAHLLGLGGAPAADETFWAIRKLLETLASRQPLVVIIDDIHWAEPTLLDLIEHVADWSRDAPILLLCMARPELLEDRPGWGGGKLNATTILLESLPEPAAGTLLDNLFGGDVDPGLRGTILTSAGGNPLFVEEMLDTLVDRGLVAQTGGRWSATEDLTSVDMPPTITALIASRLERLPGPERTVLEHGSVEGSVFHRGTVRALETDGASGEAVMTQLMDLVRKELIRPDRAEIPGDDAFRFRHLLIRDAAYQAMPKEVRADLHERFAAWLSTVDGMPEADELIGYHLEQARAYLLELGRPDERTDRLGADAADHLLAAGTKARERGDDAATTNLLSRAAPMLPHASAQHVLAMCDIARRSVFAGDTSRMSTLAEELAALRDDTDDPNLRAHLSIARLIAASYRSSTWDPQLWIGTAQDAIAIFEETGDELGLARAYDIAGWGYNTLGLFADSSVAREQAYRHGLRSGDAAIAREFTYLRTAGLSWGPVPASEGIALCREILDSTEDSPLMRGGVTLIMAALETMRGNREEGLRLYEQDLAVLRDVGRVLDLGFGSQAGWQIGWLSEDFEMAEDAARWGFELLTNHGLDDVATVSRDMLCQALYALGRYDEAERLGIEARDVATDHPEDIFVQWGWRRALGNVAAARGDLREAERLLREAFEIGEPTDALFDRSCTNLELADVLTNAGDAKEARSVLEAALAMSEAHEDVLTAGKARARLERIP
jgi:class 3 adenylate cyclase/tetratricopeptide (TPR) repeat protein